MSQTDFIMIGYDINDDFTQISWLKSSETEANTLSTVPGEESYQIPTLLCKKKDSGKWYYGTEAKRLSILGEGGKADQLLSGCLTKDVVELEGESYEPIWLLSEFLKQTFRFVVKSLGNYKIKGIVFTVPDLTEDTATVLRSCASMLGIAKDQIYVQDYQESFYHYMITVSKELWNHKVALFRYEDNEIAYYEMNSITRKKNQYFSVDKISTEHMERSKEYPEMDEKEFSSMQDQKFAGFILDNFQKKFISSVYLTGEGFDGEWAKESLRLLCSGRRVFLGKNLFSKGACIGARERMVEKLYPAHIYAGDYKVLYDIGLYMKVKGENKFCYLVRAGTSWFEGNYSCEIILDKTEQMILEIKSYLDMETRNEVLKLIGLPERPNGTMRMRLELIFLSEKRCKIILTDVGFGEFYPATDYKVQAEIKL